MEIPKTSWQVFLSNGEIAIEGHGKFEYIEAALSPYQRLLKYIEENKLTIQGMSIKTPLGNIILPSVSPKFGGEIPISFKHRRKVIRDFEFKHSGKKTDFVYNMIEATYSEYKLQLYVSENGDFNSWISLIKA